MLAASTEHPKFPTMATSIEVPLSGPKNGITVRARGNSEKEVKGNAVKVGLVTFPHTQRC